MSDRKYYFDEIDPKVDFARKEKDLLDWWEKNGIRKKYLLKNAKSKKYFSFLDGPITANNPMGVHHAWGRTYKDLWQRFYNMRGYKQRFQNGFDCQGLWVEVEVEKELGFKSKKDIDKYGISEFVGKCKDRVKKYSGIQTDQSVRLGNFMDWENSYYTMSDENNYMIWHFLKVCYDKNLIYKGTDVVPWCYRCETAISEHEILAEDYKDIEHISLYFRLPLIARENEYLLVWTTTPWTIPANIAVALDGRGDYSLVNYNDKNYWLADDLVNNIFDKDYKVLKTLKGDKLIGLKYISPFDELPANKKLKNEKYFHSVVATDSLIMPISTEEGTGLVHTSTATGAEDHHLGKKIGLPVMPTINDSAEYLSDFGFLSGKNAKKEPGLIFDYLKEKENGKYLFKLFNYKHHYPSCWRCKSELVWKLTDEWYIKIDPVRRDMKNVAGKINWLPSFGLKRELDWLSNMHDWLISKKNRYWGLALPIWECDCGNFEVIGSYGELKEKAVEGWKEFEDRSPHKPYIDEVKIKCTKCQKLMQRIPDVGNPWLDAGIVPFSTISSDNESAPLYLNKKQEFMKWFPADFITESFPGQFKNWFYSVLAMSTILENEVPYKTVLGFATLLAEDGKPMHKSWGNSIEFNEGAEKIGVDVMRWMFVRQNPAENLLFGYKIADEVRRRFHLKLWNIYNFFVTYANLNGWKPPKSSDNIFSDNILDHWILSRLKEVVDNVTTNLEKYDAFTASADIEEFVDDFSNWYLRRSRERAGITNLSKTDKASFFNTFYFVLNNLVKLLAPFLPFISEIIYKNLTKEISVHLSDWPEFAYDIEKDLLEEMKKVREVVEKAHAVRKLKNIPVRQPLSKLKVMNLVLKRQEIIKLIKDEMNVKEVSFKKGVGEIKVELDTKITPGLLEEAKTRELIRKIQQERKNMNINLDQYVYVESPWLPMDNNLLQNIKDVALVGHIGKGMFKVEVD